MPWAVHFSGSISLREVTRSALDYTAPGLWEGTILSVLCLALFFLTQILENQRRLIPIPAGRRNGSERFRLARREEEETEELRSEEES